MCTGTDAKFLANVEPCCLNLLPWYLTESKMLISVWPTRWSFTKLLVLHPVHFRNFHYSAGIHIKAFVIKLGSCEISRFVKWPNNFFHFCVVAPYSTAHVRWSCSSTHLTKYLGYCVLVYLYFIGTPNLEYVSSNFQPNLRGRIIQNYNYMTLNNVSLQKTDNFTWAVRITSCSKIYIILELILTGKCSKKIVHSKFGWSLISHLYNLTIPFGTCGLWQNPINSKLLLRLILLRNLLIIYLWPWLHNMGRSGPACTPEVWKRHRSD